MKVLKVVTRVRRKLINWIEDETVKVLKLLPAAGVCKLIRTFRTASKKNLDGPKTEPSRFQNRLGSDETVQLQVIT